METALDWITGYAIQHACWMGGDESGRYDRGVHLLVYVTLYGHLQDELKALLHSTQAVKEVLLPVGSVWLDGNPLGHTRQIPHLQVKHITCYCTTHLIIVINFWSPQSTVHYGINYAVIWCRNVQNTMAPSMLASLEVPS
jgi:hypothetical protein